MELFTAKYCLKLFLFIGAVLLGLISSSDAALTGPTIAPTAAAATAAALPSPITGPTEKPTAVSVSATVNPTAAPTVSAKLTFASTAIPTKARSANCTGSISTAELDALESLYNSTNGAKWLWRPNIYGDFGANWTFPAQVSDPCSLNWQGVTCKQVSNGKCKVEQLILNEYDLHGPLPREIGLLTGLTSLELQANRLEGTIPINISSLTGLSGNLWLNYNRLNSSIPTQISTLTSLTELALNNNELTGPLPSQLSTLNKLNYLLRYKNCGIGIH